MARKNLRGALSFRPPAASLVLSGDHDIPTAEHCVELTRLLPHARLMILPGGDYLGELLGAQPGSPYPELSAGLIEQFLDSPAQQ